MHLKKQKQLEVVNLKRMFFLVVLKVNYKKLAASATEAAKSGGGTADGTGDGTKGDSKASENEAAKAEEELKIALSEQIDKGLLNVEREGDKGYGYSWFRWFFPIRFCYTYTSSKRHNEKNC